MSKILDAYRKQNEAKAKAEGPLAVGPVAFKPLFPPPKDAQQDDFNKLANKVLGLRSGPGATIICFTATTSGEGTSFVSYNTAEKLAHVYNQNVVWIDCNFLSPNAELNKDHGTTFSDLLKNPQMVSRLRPGINPFPIGGGSDLQTTKGLLAGPNYSSVLEGLSKRFDFVILDLPPILESSDTALMALGGDGVLLVVEQEFLKWEVVNHGVEILRDKGVQVLGSVINRRKFVLPKVIYDRL